MRFVKRPVEIILVEDNPADIESTKRSLSRSSISNTLKVVKNGEKLFELLDQRGAFLPDLIILDLNMPKMSGHEVLRKIKHTPAFQAIPVIILTTSEQEYDIIKSYENYANCYIKKPIDYRGFHRAIKSIEDFWFSTVKLPTRL